MTQPRQIGVAVVGSGRIGTLRAHMAARHPSVRFLAVSDKDPERAGTLGRAVGAQLASGNNLDVIAHPEVDAVIVSTSEHEHAEPLLQAIDLGKPILVEKPLALSLDDADRVVAAADRKEYLPTPSARSKCMSSRCTRRLSTSYNDSATCSDRHRSIL